jgi:hypothetical protein
MGNPVSTGMWAAVPTAWDPNVTTAVPAVVAGDPFISRTGDRTAGFDDGGGRSYADHDLRKRGGRQQRDSEQQSREKFLHVLDSFCVGF